MNDDSFEGNAGAALLVLLVLPFLLAYWGIAALIRVLKPLKVRGVVK